MSPDPSPRATLFVASSCPHCPAVLQALSELVKKGALRELQVFNIEQAADEAQRHNIRSVPWMRIGPFTLTGLHSPQELAGWVRKAGSPEGHVDYLAELLGQGDLKTAGIFLEEDEAHLPAVLAVLGDPQRELSIRIGAGALLEELVETDAMRRLLPGLIELTRHEDSRIRGDAAHHLALSGAREAVPELQRLRDDPDTEVREIAVEGLEQLGA